MKKLILIFLTLYIATIAQAQTASDYYMPLCVGNQTILHTIHNNDGWAGRITTYTIIKTDEIEGELYYVEEALEFVVNELVGPVPFRYLWLKENNDGEIIVKAFSDEYPLLDSAEILPEPEVFFSNNILTTGYTNIMNNGWHMEIDSVISTHAICGIFDDCIQIRHTNLNNGVVDNRGDSYYARGVGLVGSNRTYPSHQVHTAVFTSTFITGCDPIVDSLPPHVVDTCLGLYFDYYANNLQVDTLNKTLTVIWVFQDGINTDQFTETYDYLHQGNNVIGITINCDRSSETYYKTVNVSSSLLGIDEPITENIRFTIYPNPASGIMTVKTTTDKNESLRLNIYDLTGKRVNTETLHQNRQQIDIGELSNGIYMVEIQSKNLSGRQKLLIQK